MAQITLDYGVRLQVMKSSIDDLQKVLDKLEPNSAGFNKLNKIIQAMRREMEDFQVQTSKPLGSQQQFNKAEKTLEKMGDDLVRAQNAIDGLKFKDIKLTDDQIDSFKQLDKELEQIDNRWQTVKNNFRDNLLGDKDISDALKSIDPNLATKDFDTIVNRLNKGIEQINKKVYEAQQKAESAVTMRDTKRNQINALTHTGISEEALGSEIFNRYFQKTAAGVTRFRTMGFAQGEFKKQFLEALKSEFQLSTKDINDLVASMSGKYMFKDFNAAFINMGKGQNNIFSGVSANLDKTVDEAQKKLDEYIEQQRKRQAALAAFNSGLSRDAEGRAIGEVAKAEDERTAAIERNTAARRVNQEAVVSGVSKDEAAASSARQFKNELQNLTSQVQSANTEFLRLQQTEQTFNSIRSAITNFMGFNQVLNLTRTAVREAMNHIKQLDETMNGIAIVTDMTTEDLWKQIDTYSKVAQTYGTTIQGAYEVSKIYYQAGYETNDVLALMNETLKLSKVSGLDYAKATDYMMTA